MPITKSAKKAHKKSLVKAERNKATNSRVKTYIKKIETLAKQGKFEDAKKVLPMAFKTIDMAAKKNLLHKNTAARKKSNLYKMAEGTSKQLVKAEKVAKAPKAAKTAKKPAKKK